MSHTLNLTGDVSGAIIGTITIPQGVSGTRRVKVVFDVLGPAPGSDTIVCVATATNLGDGSGLAGSHTTSSANTPEIADWDGEVRKFRLYAEKSADEVLQFEYMHSSAAF